ncbi:CamS family sex pheromone protein [Lactobacillus sp. Sy-1]|uniref:CamS family sex pheromone protein n=1 Tax=Lactobacillus sp. Sy-1 TaxID=2109645 RepID=UPI00351D259E
MSLKRFSVIIAALASVILLAACGSSNSSTSSSKSSKTNDTQLTGQSDGSYYQSVIKNGHYLTSKSRGVNVQQNGNQLNLKSFEAGLMNISKKQFSTGKYVFQEGQYVSTDTAENWLGRKTKSNPEGLNPAGKNTKVPLYLQQMDEQDFLTQDGNSLKMSGMTIGLGINSVYYYQKQAYGATYQMNLSDAEIKAQGKKMANEVLARLRKTKALKNIPIVIALYKQAPDDSLVGGNFFAYSVNNGSSTSVSNWTAVNEKNYVFPVASGQKGPSNNSDENDFSNFKTQIQNFFPNLSGVTAQAQYMNGSLTGMNVNITTQFYSQTEIISFTQYLQSTASKYLPTGVPIDITVSSTTGVQSFLSRSTNAKNFTFHIFNSY